MAKLIPESQTSTTRGSKSWRKALVDKQLCVVDATSRSVDQESHAVGQGLAMGGISPPFLSNEQIYDTLFDEEAFRELPDLLARTVGARSAVLAWRYRDGGTEVLHHNGYFTDAHFADYAANYADKDPWVAVAYRPQRMNRAIRMDDEVDATSVRHTAFYNDWLRGMGDDTLHCLGAATTVSEGEGIIGLHRGAGASGAFTPDEGKRLALLLPHLARLLVFRGKMAAAARQTRYAEAALDATGMAVLIVDAGGHMRMANVAGEAAIRKGHLPALSSAGLVRPGTPLSRAVEIATRSTGQSASVVLEPQHDGGQSVVRVAPYKDLCGRRDAIISFRPEPDQAFLREQLRLLFALTPAEADVALLLAKGKQLADVAARRGTTLETVRSQLRVIRGKTRCGRQVELAALVNSLPGVG